MSNKNENRELKVSDTNAGGAKLSKLQLLKKQERNEKIKRYCTLAAIIAIIAAIIIAIVVINYNKTAKLGKTVCGTSEKYEITNDMVAYFMTNQRQSLFNNYSSYLSTIGYDTSKSWKQHNPNYMATMYLGFDSEMTWFENFAHLAMNQLEELVAIASEAQEKGVELDEEELAAIDDNIDYVKSAAKENGVSTNEYLASIYTNGVTTKALKKCLELQQLASKYYQQLTNAYVITDEDCEKFVQDNKESFFMSDYIYYSFKAEVAEGADKPTEEALAAAKAKAEEFLAKATDLDAFKAAVNELEKKEETESKETDEKKAEPWESYLKEGVAYNDTTDLGKWLGDEATKTGDTKIIESETGADVYLVVKAMYRDEDSLRDVRHILVEKEEDAKDILATWENGEKTAESFGELANKHSTDPGSNTTGGLYEGVGKGEMVEEFENWLFDEARKEGDTGIVKTDYGYHIMYYVGESMKWHKNAKDGVLSERYSEDAKALKAKFPLTFDTDKILEIS